jgi:hypothetical protein
LWVISNEDIDNLRKENVMTYRLIEGLLYLGLGTVLLLRAIELL